MWWSYLRSTSILLVSAIVGSFGQYDFDYFGNLGSQITAQVNAELAPLNNLGERISASVARSLKPLDNLGDQINRQVQHSLRGLDGLENRIAESVNKGLEPVRALELRVMMMEGVGGVTIATTHPSGRTFIIKNNNIYQCSGTIDSSSGSCSGKLKPLEIQTDQDWCSIPSVSHSIINNYICLSTGSISIQAINNQVNCQTTNPNDKLLFMNYDDFLQMCRNVAGRITYRYIADNHDPRHVQLPNPNTYVKCNNNEKGVCEFTEQKFTSRGGRGGSIHIVSY